LPEFTFNKLAATVGYKRPAPEAKPTWQDLKDSFDTQMKQQILIGKRAEATQQRYGQTFKEFDTFLKENGIVYLSQIDNLVVEKFKTWRFERIKKRKESRSGAGLVLDVAILHRIFGFAIKPRKWISENPVEFIGKPGDPDSGAGGAEPFDSKQLTALQKHAGEDLLAFMLLRWTGLRGSDGVALSWKEVHFDRREIERVTKKRRKKVIVPIHSSLLALLEMERERRQPDPDDTVLLNPATGKSMDRHRLYLRMVAVGKRAGVPDSHPHRFRDTFAVDMLARGCSPYDVAKLLGDTIEMVEKHYGHFVKELRERVRRMMEDRQGGLEAFSTDQELAQTLQ
jgi:integrase